MSGCANLQTQRLRDQQSVVSHVKHHYLTAQVAGHGAGGGSQTAEIDFY